MSKRTGGLAISYAVDEASSSDNDDDLVPSNQPPADSKAPSEPAKAVRRGRTISKAVSTNPGAKPRKRRSSAESTAGEKEPTKTARTRAKRPARKEVPNTQAANESGDEDDLDLAPDPSVRAMSTPMTATKTTAARPKKPASDAKPRAPRGRPKKQVDDEIHETQQDVHASSSFGRNTAVKKPPKPAKREETVPETQVEPMEVDTNATNEMEKVATPKPPVMKPPQKKRAASQQRQPTAARKRAGSASDTEKAADPALRRKLDDMTKRFDAVSVKYDQLRDVGIGEAESNFDKLKARSDERIKAADALIASLQRDLATQTALAFEATNLRSEITTLRDSHGVLTSSSKSLQTSLTTAQNEIKTLQAKLAASRSTSEQAANRSGAPPNSAAKGPTGNRNGAVIAGDAERRVLKLKEDLYADLTGLIVRDVKRREAEGEEVYDCIQTGRNGTLRFQLTVPTSMDGTSYDDAEFAYEPVFDTAGNDRSLIAMLPDYLTEEICFPRRQAGKFYARIVEVLSRRMDDERAAGGEEGGMNGVEGEGAEEARVGA